MNYKVVTEISCYIENKPGILASISSKLAEAGVFIDGIQVYEGQLQSLVLLVVDDNEKTEQVLRNAGIDLITKTEILDVEISHAIGGLASFMKIFEKGKVNIKTIYSSNSTTDISMAYVKVDDINRAIEVLDKDAY